MKNSMYGAWNVQKVRVRVVVEDLNPVLRGWGAYFRQGNSSAKFGAIDRVVHERVAILASRKHSLRIGCKSREDKINCGTGRAWKRQLRRPFGLSGGASTRPSPFRVIPCRVVGKSHQCQTSKSAPE